MTMRPLAGREVLRVGLGCMGMSEFYGGRDDERALATLRAAYELGCRHFDTADMYGSGHNETLLGRFLADLGPRRRDVLVATKVGFVRDPASKYKMSLNGRREFIQGACEASLRRLGVEQIGLYYLHRQDPETPITESMGALGDLVRQGKVAAVGLCEVTALALEAAHHVHPVAAVQSEYSLWSRDIEQEVGPLCSRMKIPLVSFSPLGRGILTGTLSKTQIRAMDPAQDLRPNLPRFQEAHLDTNLALVERLRLVAAQLEITPAQVALAWVLSKGEDVHIIPGSTSTTHLETNLAAESVVLPEWAVTELEAVFTASAVSGGRYPGRAEARPSAAASQPAAK